VLSVGELEEALFHDEPVFSAKWSAIGYGGEGGEVEIGSRW